MVMSGTLGRVVGLTGAFESQSTLPQPCKMCAVNIPSMGSVSVWSRVCVYLGEKSTLDHTERILVLHKETTLAINCIPLVAKGENCTNTITGQEYRQWLLQEKCSICDI